MQNIADKLLDRFIDQAPDANKRQRLPLSEAEYRQNMNKPEAIEKGHTTL